MYYIQINKKKAFMEKYEYLTKVFIINYKLGILPSWYPHPIPKYIQSIAIKFYDIMNLAWRAGVAGQVWKLGVSIDLCPCVNVNMEYIQGKKTSWF